MTGRRSDFIKTVTARGFVHQCTDFEALDRMLSGGTPRPCYIGFDCTANSLHVGSLLPIMLLRWYQKTGHRPIVLMGGGTTRVGDPSGRDESRQLLTEPQIAANKQGIQRVFERFLSFGEGPSDAIMMDNADWLNDLEYIPFLREYGRHFSINRMLGFDSVRLRLEREQSLTFLEFNYMILQAYDFLELYRRTGCILQMGGSDQWGNIVNGVELARRVDGAELFGLTSPLVTTASGAKMGKTAEGAVWLNAERVGPYDYWQYWRNTADADVGRFLRLFTELPLDEISRLEGLQGAEINEAKKILADEATSLCHGRDAAAEARRTSEDTFEQGDLSDGLPTVNLPRGDLEHGMPAFILLNRAGLAETNSAARRIIRGGGGRLNGERITDEHRSVSLSDLDSDGKLKISSGRKRHVLVRLV